MEDKELENVNAKPKRIKMLARYGYTKEKAKKVFDTCYEAVESKEKGWMKAAELCMQVEVMAMREEENDIRREVASKPIGVIMNADQITVQIAQLTKELTGGK